MRFRFHLNLVLFFYVASSVWKKKPSEKIREDEIVYISLVKLRNSMKWC